jgi:transposase InsO family protein
MTGSMSLTGNCWDGACIESWHSLLKQELVHCSRFRTRTEVTRRSSKSIAIFYNRHRLHSALGYRIPAEVEADGAD